MTLHLRLRNSLITDVRFMILTATLNKTLIPRSADCLVIMCHYNFTPQMPYDLMHHIINNKQLAHIFSVTSKIIYFCGCIKNKKQEQQLFL